MLNLSILPVLSKNCSNWLPLWKEVGIKIHPVRYLRTVTVSVKGKQSPYRSWLLCHHDGNPQPPQYMFSTTTTSPAKNKVDVQIVEVGPRDGLQNEKITITTKDKVTLIEMLVEAGCTKIEAGSFVNPLIVPKMANSMDVIQSLSNVRTNAGSILRISALVPTAKYLQSALTAKVDEIAIFASASEAFSQKNLNCSIEESMLRFRDILAITKDIHMPVRGYLSCVIACPYQGPIDSKVVGQYTEQLLELGCCEVSLGDTIGVGTPKSTSNMLNDALVATGGQPNLLAVHFHDTYGQALSNILVSLEQDIATVDSSVAGLGGCPYAKGASGNVATEDLVYMLNGIGVTTGVDIDKLVEAGEFICGVLGRPSNSKAGTAIVAKRRKEQ